MARAKSTRVFSFTVQEASVICEMRKMRPYARGVLLDEMRKINRPEQTSPSPKQRPPGRGEAS